MFDFVLKTRDGSGKLLIRRFDTASEFLGLCEIVRSDYLLDEVVEGVEYGDQDVSLVKPPVVDALSNQAQDCITHGKKPSKHGTERLQQWRWNWTK